MKVLLQQDVPDVGRKYDVKNVADGYALNFLIPHKLAVFASDLLVAQAEKQRVKHAESVRVEQETIAARVKELHDKKITITAKASETGGLFAGIDAETIAHALNKEFKLALSEENIELEKPIKEIGEYEIPVVVGEAHAKIFLRIVAK